MYTCKGKQYTSNKNSIIITPKGCSYEWKLRKSGPFTFCTFDADLTFEELFCFQIANPEPYLAAFHRMESLRYGKPQLYHMGCIMEIYNILFNLIKSDLKEYTPNVQQEKLRPAMDYIKQHFTQDISSDELAAKTRYSASHFRKLFLEVYGVSPIAYIHSMRIARAKELLLSEFGSITTIAQALGYASIYDFSRAFKRETGVSPMAYLKSQRNR